MSEPLALIVDPDRALPDKPGLGTGIYVRATLGDKWGSFDIVELTCESLIAWLRSRGGRNEWAESVVCMMLGWAPDYAAERLK